RPGQPVDGRVRPPLLAGPAALGAGPARDGGPPVLAARPGVQRRGRHPSLRRGADADGLVDGRRTRPAGADGRRDRPAAPHGAVSDPTVTSSLSLPNPVQPVIRPEWSLALGSRLRGSTTSGWSVNASGAGR